VLKPNIPSRRKLWIAVLSVVAVVLVLVLAGTVILIRHLSDPAGDAALKGAGPSRPPVTTANGVFIGTSRADAEAYQDWFGSTGAGKIDRIVDFSSRETWAQVANPKEMLAEWKGSGFRPVYSVALLPDRDDSATLQRGAAGEYDKYYRQLAKNLIKADQADAILRLGWEFNLEYSRWGSDDSTSFIAYWRRIVTAMRAVKGQKFQFDWNPNNGDNKYDAVSYYPGDDVVDYIGVDAYDVSWGLHTYPYPGSCDNGCRTSRQTNAWKKSVYGGKRGLKFWSAFARRRGKPMSLPEWGLWDRQDGHGGGNDPAYLRRMHDFIADPQNGVAYQAYFEFDGSDGPHRLMTTFAASGDTFRSLFART
jgi:hypothetical protein